MGYIKLIKTLSFVILRYIIFAIRESRKFQKEKKKRKRKRKKVDRILSSSKILKF
jgi:hypothetical protein